MKYHHPHDQNAPKWLSTFPPTPSKKTKKNMFYSSKQTNLLYISCFNDSDLMVELGHVREILSELLKQNACRCQYKLVLVQ
mmetsp:Transcript_4325/g.11202  ORF Transcript_4325/g.11202 Transcript_4325/m.11202 type:complete len:81 (+) Transcript_4325:2486-2728(+)